MSLSYEHVVSRGAHVGFRNEVFERQVEADREIWFGSDGSGLIKTTLIRSTFFTEQQHARWETNEHSPASQASEPRFNLFAPGRLRGHGPMLSKLPADPAELVEELSVKRELALHGIRELMGEALVPEGLRRALYQVAAGLPGADVLATSTDELGRTGHGIARVEEIWRNQHGWRVELTFDPNNLELLGYRETLLHPEPDFAPAGALVGWTSYLTREIVDSLPIEASSLPKPSR